MTLTKPAVGLNGNQLKLIALVSMTIDHIGVQLLPHVTILRIIGRLALPIFAYMIAQGCRYTRNKGRYLLQLFAVGFVCQVVYFFAMGSLYQCIFVTFSLSVCGIYLLEFAKKQKIMFCGFLCSVSLAVIYFLTDILPLLLPGTDFRIDYGFAGVLLPVLIYLGKNQKQQLLMTLIGVVLLALQLGGIQWIALAAVPLLALYDGTRGKAKLKYLFYIYYPAHLVALYLLDLLI